MICTCKVRRFHRCDCDKKSLCKNKLQAQYTDEECIEKREISDYIIIFCDRTDRRNVTLRHLPNQRRHKELGNQKGETFVEAIHPN